MQAYLVSRRAVPLMAIEFTRRTFLTGAGGAVALLGYLGWRVSTSGIGRTAGDGTPGPIPRIAYASYEDIWRAKWRCAASRAHSWCWYQRGCNWNVCVRDGIVWRRQSGTYEQIDAKIPDYNPRGCQKGACYSSACTTVRA